MAELSLEREEAFGLFKDNKGFFESLEASNEEDIDNLIINCTETSRKALLYLLFFISKKEIPIMEQAVSKMNRVHLNLLRGLISKSFKDILNDDEKEREIVKEFSKIFPYLIYPILHRQND